MQEFILRREIDSQVGQPLDTTLLMRDRRKLDGFRLFSEVRPEIKAEGDSADVIFHLKEVWTLWPLLGLSRSDHSFDWLLGVREKDFLGLYMQTSIYYRRYEGQNSYGFSAQLPRAFGRDLALGINLGDSRQIDPLSFIDSTSSNLITRDYRYQSKYLWFNAGTRISERFYVRGLVGYERENWAADDERTLPSSAHLVFDFPRYSVGASATVGRVYFDDFFFEGPDLTISGTLINEQPDGSFEKWRLGLVGREYLIFEPFNLALRGQYGSSSADERFAPYYISGVTNVRGYEDKIERGDRFLGGNIELRWRGPQSSLFYTQLAAFSDIGAVWGRDRAFSDAWESPYASIGIGLRLAIRKFLGRIGRLDLARDTKTGNWEYYLSAYQFF